MRRFLNFIVLFLCISSVYGQAENTLYLLENVYQSSYINPTATPQNTLSIGLPGISSIHAYGLIDYLTLENITTEENGKLVVDEDKIANNSKLTNKNYINSGQSVDLFSFRVKINKNFWGLNITDKLDYSFRYPKEFLQLLADGNAQFEGKTVDLSTLAVNATAYREISVSFLHVGEKLNWSVKPKILFGKLFTVYLMRYFKIYDK